MKYTNEELNEEQIFNARLNLLILEAFLSVNKKKDKFKSGAKFEGELLDFPTKQVRSRYFVSGFYKTDAIIRVFRYLFEEDGKEYLSGKKIFDIPAINLKIADKKITKGTLESIADSIKGGSSKTIPVNDIDQEVKKVYELYKENSEDPSINIIVRKLIYYTHKGNLEGFEGLPSLTRTIKAINYDLIKTSTLEELTSYITELEKQLDIARAFKVIKEHEKKGDDKQ